MNAGDATTPPVIQNGDPVREHPGAAAAILIALVLSRITQAHEAGHGLAKSSGVLLLVWVVRKHFEGPVDGIVYAAMVAIGFASGRYHLRRQYRKFVQDATRLAFSRQRLLSGRPDIGSRASEADLVDAIVQDRRALAALPPPLVVRPR